MVKVIVTRPIVLDLGGDNRFLGPGEHELSEKEMSYWSIPGLISAGVIICKEKTTAPAEIPMLNYEKKEVIFGQSNTVKLDMEFEPVISEDSKPKDKEEAEDQKEIIEENQKPARFGRRKRS